MYKCTLTPTEFINRPSGITTYGYRAYDDNKSVYDNLWDSIPDDDLEFLEKVTNEAIAQQAPDVVVSMLEHCAEFGLGIHIDEMFYSYDEIKHLLEKLDPTV